MFAEFIGEIKMVDCSIVEIDKEVYVKALNEIAIKVILDHDNGLEVGQDMLLVFRPENIAIIIVRGVGK